MKHCPGLIQMNWKAQAKAGNKGRNNTKEGDGVAEVEINPGVCGLKTVVRVHSEDMQNAVIEISTECPNIKPMELELKEVDGYAECFSKLGDSTVYELARKYCRHAACPVPPAILKGIEVACGLALPRDVHFTITKD